MASSKTKFVYFSRPGFARLNLPYFMNKETIDFILNAVEFIAEHGWKFLPMVSLQKTKFLLLFYPISGTLWKLIVRRGSLGGVLGKIAVQEGC